MPVRAARIWAVLVGMTALSWTLGNAHSASVLILVLALVKARLVGIHFMGLRSAPVALRALFEVWCAAVCAAVVAALLLA